MPDIPSVGIDLVDIVDPGVVNIEEQAYPRVLQPDQALALELGVLIESSLFASPFAANPAQAIEPPTEIDVGLQSFIFPFSLGTAVPDINDVDVNAQSLVDGRTLREFIVTGVGSFQTNAVIPTQRTFLADTVTSFVFGPNTYYTITFAADVDLFSFGIEFSGTEVAFPDSAPAESPNQIPEGLVISFSTRQIVVLGTFLSSDPPVAGDRVVFNLERQGDEVVFDFDTVTDVFIFADTPPQSPEEIPVPVNFDVFAGNFFPEGVPTFIGEGTEVPFLIFQNLRDGVFEVENQTFGQGLPAQVFIG